MDDELDPRWGSFSFPKGAGGGLLEVVTLPTVRSIEVRVQFPCGHLAKFLMRSVEQAVTYLQHPEWDECPICEGRPRVGEEWHEQQ